MATGESLKLKPLKRTPVPQHFPQKGFSSKIFNNDQESASTSGYNFETNRIVSLHRSSKSYYFKDTYNDRNFIERYAQRIVNKLEQNRNLLEDTPASQLLREQTLKDLPQSLTIKRCVKAKLSKAISLAHDKPIGFAQKFRLNWTRFKENGLVQLELWYGSLKRIEGHFGSSYASFFKFLRYLFVLNLCLTVPIVGFIVAPQIVDDLHGNSSGTSRGFKFQDIFIGDGFLRNTTLYYGHYTNQIIHPNYNMPIAYFSVMLIIYLISFIILSVSVATSYRRNFIETEGGLKNIYANKLFCSWDFGIATKNGAALKSDTIYNEIKELLSESLEDDEDKSCLHQFRTITIQIIVNSFILILITSIGYGLWLLLDKYALIDDDIRVIPAIITNLILMILPVLFNAVTKYENYKNPRIALYSTLIRTYLLGIVIIGVTVLFWLFKLKECWETFLGQEIYRLTVFDFIFSVILKSIIELIWFIIMKKRGYKTPTVEFDIATNTLQIIYNQTLLLIGLLYSPLLSLLIVLKLFIIWYIRDWSVRKLCRPLKRSWRAAQTHTYFLMITFLTNIIIITLHAYTITSVKISKTCGPFRDHNYIYEVITDGDGIEKKIIFYLTKPWIVTLIIIALSIGVYYLREKAQAQRDKVKLLRELLVWSAKDKQFLLEHIRTTTGREDFVSQSSRSSVSDFDFN